MNRKPNVWTYVSISVVALLLACKLEGRVGYNKDDLKESQVLVEQYLENIKNKHYDAALELTTDQLKSSITPDNLKTSIEGFFEGELIQNWSLKSHQIVQGSPRYIHLLYEVKSTTGTQEMEMTTELIANPFRWKIASVKLLNNDVAAENAHKADVVANQFLQHLQSSDFAEAYQLTSPLCQKATPKEALIEVWTQIEESTGAIQRWTLKGFQDTTADFSGDRKHYTMLIYEIEGLKGHVVGGLTMLRTESGWKIEGIKIQS